MNVFKKFLAITLLLGCSVSSAFSAEDSFWKNDLRSKFLDNKTVIMEINLRSFNSNDVNGDGFIQENLGENRGTFINAIERLDELKSLGINTLHVLPITPTGKLKALGTAGSLYSASSFDSLNPELVDIKSDLTLDEQAKKFIAEAHKRDIRIIVDVPACGSYDLYLQRPDLFVTSQSGEPIIPLDWTDVRLFAPGSKDKVDSNVYSLYKDFVKYVMSLGVDGIRADVAHSKTKLFWQELIDYSRDIDPEFLWLAESSESWSEPISPQTVFTSHKDLLDAGFDGYYGSFFELKDFKSAKDFHENISYTLNETKNYKTPKSVIGSFSTHDEISPILIKGKPFSEMIIWLNATLPVNSYFVDGFQFGDDYLYLKGNKLAEYTKTDDDIYFTHRGKIDIFNLSRKPEGRYPELSEDIKIANSVKESIVDILNNGSYTKLNTTNNKVFAYMFANNIKKVVVVGNLDYINKIKATVKIPKFNPRKQNMLPLKISEMPATKRGRISMNLKPGEIVVVLIHELL